MTKAAAPGGRPRQSGIVADRPREGIISIAAQLFAKRGFNATRMSEVAQAAGLRQSSIYYWFRSKDEILRAIMEQNRVSLTAARALSDRPEVAAVRLYIVLYQDVIQMCSAPLNFYALEEAAVHQPEVFADFRVDYEELSDRLQRIVDAGVAAGEFDTCGRGDLVRTMLSLNEGVQHRFHARGADPGELHPDADAAARTSLRALLTDTATLPAIAEHARTGIAGFRALVDEPAC